MLLQGIYYITGIRLDTELKGYFDQEDKPRLTLSDFISGDYQTRYDKWLNANMLPRGTIIKLYNQITYGLFSQGNRIVGRHGNIFESGGYIKDAMTIDDCNFSLSENQILLEDYVQHLESIQQKLEAIDKFFLIYTTPSKAIYSMEDIPVSYQVQNEHGIRAIDYFHQLLDGRNINYFDTSNVPITEEFPLFYSTGIHWARPFEQQASLAILEILSAISGQNLRNFELQDMTASDQPFWRDTDVYDLLNMFAPPPKQTYYEYLTVKTYPEKYDKTRILLQGGSFAQSLLRDYFEQYTNGDVFYINYDNYIQDADGNIQSLLQWSDLDLGYYPDRVDFIVIELNEAVINQYSSGFAEYLDHYLDTYIPHPVTISDMETNMNATEKTILDKTRGYYEYGNEAFVWTKDSCSVTLQNGAIISEGILFDLGIHEELLKYGDVQLTVYVNQTKSYEVTLSQAGMYSLILSPEDLGNTQDDIYEIELLCDRSFNPKERGMSNDDRDLAIMVYYIGENR